MSAFLIFCRLCIYSDKTRNCPSFTEHGLTNELKSNLKHQGNLIGPLSWWLSHYFSYIWLTLSSGLHLCTSHSPPVCAVCTIQRTTALRRSNCPNMVDLQGKSPEYVLDSAGEWGGWSRCSGVGNVPWLWGFNIHSGLRCPSSHHLILSCRCSCSPDPPPFVRGDTQGVHTLTE